jgi:hypothetical protein
MGLPLLQQPPLPLALLPCEVVEETEQAGNQAVEHIRCSHWRSERAHGGVVLASALAADVLISQEFMIQRTVASRMSPPSHHLGKTAMLHAVIAAVQVTPCRLRPLCPHLAS